MSGIYPIHTQTGRKKNSQQWIKNKKTKKLPTLNRSINENKTNWTGRLSNQASKKPVILRTEFRWRLKSLPFKVQTENAICSFILLSIITCGGVLSSSSSSVVSHLKYRKLFVGILTGDVFSAVTCRLVPFFSSFLVLKSLVFWILDWSENIISDSWNSSDIIVISKMYIFRED